MNRLILITRSKGILPSSELQKKIPNFFVVMYPLWRSVFESNYALTTKDLTIEAAVELVTRNWRDIYLSPYLPEFANQIGFEHINKSDDQRSFQRNKIITTLNDVPIWATLALDSLLSFGEVEGFDDKSLEGCVDDLHILNQQFYNRMHRFT